MSCLIDTLRLGLTVLFTDKAQQELFGLSILPVIKNLMSSGPLRRHMAKQLYLPGKDGPEYIDLGNLKAADVLFAGIDFK